LRKKIKTKGKAVERLSNNKHTHDYAPLDANGKQKCRTCGLAIFSEEL